MAKVKNEVNIKIISSAGHDEWSGSADEAIGVLNQYVKKDGKWLYVDGTYTAVDDVTPEALAEAEDVTVTNALAGGQ